MNTIIDAMSERSEMAAEETKTLLWKDTTPAETSDLEILSAVTNTAMRTTLSERRLSEGYVVEAAAHITRGI
jgi:hypothetical protein